MNARFVKSPERKRISEQLEKQFGISKLPYLLIETGKEKLRAFSGSLSKEEIMQLGQLANIEIIGLYLIKKELNNQYRLSFDATQLLKNQISKNVLEISDEQLHEWIRGSDLIGNGKKEIFIIKNNNDLIGCGNSNGEKIFNYVPKERRLRK